MKSRQVGYVLIALIVIGVAGLIVRLVSAGSDELTLEGILPVTPDVIDTVVIQSPTSQAELVKINGIWQIERDPAFLPKMNQLWASVGEIDGAQLIATNPANHQRMGVTEGQGTKVSFKLGGFTNEEFIVGKWTQDVRLCYLRKPGRNEVYGVPCPLLNIFDADPNGWRNPLVASIPRNEVESVTFTYPDEEFVLRPADRGWVVENSTESEPADIFIVSAVLNNLELLVARNFASLEESEGLDFNGPDAISVRVATLEDASTPTTRIRFLPRDDISFYARTPTQSTIFIVDRNVTNSLLLRMQDFIGQN